MPELPEWLYGGSVRVRLLTETDSAALHAFRQENRAFLKPFEPKQADEHFTPGYIRELLVRWTIEREQGLAYSFGIFSLDQEELVGTLRLSSIVRGVFQNAMLGYALAQRQCGRGWMTEAVRLVLGFAFKRLELHRVQANVMPRNLPSQRVLEKNGFRREGYSPFYLNIDGVWEDHLCYAITAEDYEPRYTEKL